MPRTPQNFTNNSSPPIDQAYLNALEDAVADAVNKAVDKLAGGTTGQAFTKNSSDNHDFVWAEVLNQLAGDARYQRTFQKDANSGYPGLAADQGIRDGSKFLKDDGTWDHPGANLGGDTNAAVVVTDYQHLEGTLDAALTQAGDIYPAYIPGALEASLSCEVLTAGTGELRAQYSTNAGTSWNYLSSSGSGPAVDVSTTGLKDSGWISIANAAKTNVLLRLVSLNGDGDTVEVEEAVVRVRGTGSTGGGSIVSVFGRTGIVAPAPGDYTASDVVNEPAGSITAEDLQGAVNELDAKKSAVEHAHGISSIPSLRSATETTLPVTLTIVSGWNSGSEEGGGIFQVDADDIASSDDGGTVIIDASGRKWKRVFFGAPGVLTPFMFGAQEGVDSTAQVQAMIDVVRASYNITEASWKYVADLAGRSWQVTSINCTRIRQPYFTLQNGTLHGIGAGKIVLDLAGANSVNLTNLTILGDKTNTPTIGTLLSRTEEDNFAGAPYHKKLGCRWDGFFTKAAEVNFASESNTEVNCIYRNKRRYNGTGLPAYTRVLTGHAYTLDTYLGGVTSEFVTIPTQDNGFQSCIQHEWGALTCLRSPDLALKIQSISRSNPATVTVQDPSLLASQGLTGGNQVYFHGLTGMDELDRNFYTVTNVNLTAGTFQLSGVNSITYTPFVSGNVYNRTGPALLVGYCHGLRFRAGYLLAYGNDTMVWDCKELTTAASNSSQDHDIHFQGEAHPTSLIRFELPASGQALIRNLNVACMGASQIYKAALLNCFRASGTGIIKFENLKVTLPSVPSAPTMVLFGGAGNVSVYNADIRVPSSVNMNAISSFDSFSGQVYTAADDRLHHYGLSFVPVKTVATLPSGLGTPGEGGVMFASNGRKSGELAGAGTGVLVFHDGTSWRACDTGFTVLQ